jgi:hypothetical protein
MPRGSLVERFYCDFADNPLGEAIHPRQGRVAVPQGLDSAWIPIPGLLTSDGSLADAAQDDHDPQLTPSPPSTASDTPVTKPAWSECRYSAA